MSPFEENVFDLAERTALLLACLRNYKTHHYDVDLTAALGLEPEVMVLLDRVRDQLPRPE